VIARALIILVLFSAAARADRQEDIETVGDVIALALPLSAGITATAKRDWGGLKQWVLSWGTSTLVVDRMKANTRKQRPNEEGTNSFPSGHMASATTGAAFFQTRYGAAWGVPAYALAAFTGYSRIQADKHFPGDVLAGMSISMLLNWAYVRPHPDDWRIFPKKTAQGYAIQFDWLRQERDWFATVDPEPFEPRWRFEWEFGAADRRNNLVQAPEDTGTPIDLAQLDDVQNPTFYSRVTFERRFDRRHEVALVLAPLGISDHGELDQPSRFGDALLPADTTVHMKYLTYDIGVRYRYSVFDDDSRWVLKPGVALTWQHTSVEMYTDGGDADEVSGSVLLPVLHLQAGINLTAKWQVLADIDWIELGSNRRLDFATYIRWGFARHWDLSGGWRWAERGTDYGTFSNRFEQQRFLLAFGYSW